MQACVGLTQACLLALRTASEPPMRWEAKLRRAPDPRQGAFDGSACRATHISVIHKVLIPTTSRARDESRDESRPLPAARQWQLWPD